MTVMSVFDVDDPSYVDVPVEERLVVEPLAAAIMNFDSNGIKEFDECVMALEGMGTYRREIKKLDLDLKNRPTPPAKPFIEEPPVLELRKLPKHLRYVFLCESNTLLVIISASLSEVQVSTLVAVL